MTAGMYGNRLPVYLVRQSVHIGAQGYDRPGVAAVEQSDNAGTAYAGFYAIADFFELCRQKSRGFDFSMPHLGYGVQILLQFFYSFVHIHYCLLLSVVSVGFSQKRPAKYA
jgi:hypothetical protein